MSIEHPQQCSWEIAQIAIEALRAISRVAFPNDSTVLAAVAQMLGHVLGLVASWYLAGTMVLLRIGG